MGADRIAQTMYDLAQKISHLRFGWSILLAAMGTRSAPYFTGTIKLCLSLVVISFPPAIGHTTLTTLCGFAYGMKGFYLAAAGSVIGSALAFIVLRFLFGHRLKKWSRSNEKWQALESVVVSACIAFSIIWPLTANSFAEGSRLAPYNAHSCFPVPSMGLRELALRCEYDVRPRRASSHMNYVIVNRGRCSMAVYNRYHHGLPQSRIACIHRIAARCLVRWRDSPPYGHT